MSQLPLRLCKKAGCPNLVPHGVGYCEAHTTLKKQEVRSRFDYLDKNKTQEYKDFYSSFTWTKVSREHRVIEPLCRRCKVNGFVVPAEVVHHNPSYKYLIDNNLNPFNHEYLESLCFSCHQRNLSDRRTS